MKLYKVFFLLSLVFLFSTRGIANDMNQPRVDWIATDFKNLDQVSQKKMILELREIMASLNGPSELFSQYHDTRLLMLGTLIAREALALNVDNKIAAVESAELFERTRDTKHATMALTLLIAEAHKLKGQPQSTENQKLILQFEALKTRIESKAKGLGVHSLISHMMYNQELIFQTITGAKPKVQQSSLLPKKTVARAVKVSEHRQFQESEIKDREPSYSYSACMYAGFVIEDVVCRAPREIPSSDLLNMAFNRNTFKCENSEVMCNPLLFGFEGECSVSKADSQQCLEQAKPVCIANSVSATLNCKNQTKNDRYLENTLVLLKAKPELLSQYLSSFYKLCDEAQSEKNRLIYKDAQGTKRKNSDRIKKDIVTTCAVAIPQLQTVLKRYEAIAKQPSGAGQVSPGNSNVPVKK